jgi:hypothetical protein
MNRHSRNGQRLRIVFGGLEMCWVPARRLAKWSSRLCISVLFLFARPAYAQTWTWSDEYIESGGGQSSSAAVDRQNNLHVVYRVPSGGFLRYAFRPAGSTRWFKMDLEKDLGNFSTRIALDAQDNPHVCYTPREIRYAKFDGHKWFSQIVDPGAGTVDYECSIRITPEGKPMLAWYWPGGGFHYGVLREGVWLALILDGNGGDYAGKWNSMVLDAQGNPQIAYSDFPGGELRYAINNGQAWIHTALDSQTNGPGGPKGMGVAMVLDANQDPWISYYDEQSLMMMHRVSGKWVKQVVERLPQFRNWGWKQFHSDIALDKNGNPHIVFESLRGLEHAWWNGSEWKIQIVLAPAIISSYFDDSMTMGKDDTIYVTYTDPLEHSLKLAVGRLSSDSQSSNKVARAEKHP